MSSEPQPGTLYVVATPIGNLDDFSPRAATILRDCDLVACEDTRTSQKLFTRLGISPKTCALHEHNERAQASQLVGKLKAGASIALISDAGTPAISDPGFRLVRACRHAGVPVSPIPGPSAGLAALAASGLPSNAFLFRGFLPPKRAARLRFLEEHQKFPHTIILYESRYRIVSLVEDVLNTLGPERTLALAREMTKRHETFVVGLASAVAEHLKSHTRKGEFVVLVAPEGFVL